MQRSNTLSNFMDSKSRKKWTNPFSKSTKATSNDSRSSSVSSTSSVLSVGSITRSQSTLSINSRPLSNPSSTPAEVKLRNRSSLMISSSTKRSSTQKHRSVIGFGSLELDTTAVTDPKELEFYNQLLHGKVTGTIMEEYEEDDDDEYSIEGQERQSPNKYKGHSASSSLSQSSTEMCSTSTPTTDASSQQSLPEKSNSEALSSALEDYQLFTKRKSMLLTPTTPIFPTTLPTDEIDAVCNLTSSDSLPSLSSLDTMESELSVMKVSNSLWVGITDEDENLTRCDALDGFDADAVFDDKEYLSLTRSVKFSPHRTSLIFY